MKQKKKRLLIRASSRGVDAMGKSYKDEEFSEDLGTLFHVPTAQLPGAGRRLSDNRPRKRSPENGSMRQELQQSASQPPCKRNKKDNVGTLWILVVSCSITVCFAALPLCVYYCSILLLVGVIHYRSLIFARQNDINCCDHTANILNPLTPLIFPPEPKVQECCLWDHMLCLQLNYPKRSPSHTFLLYMYSLVSNVPSSMRNLLVSEFSGGRCPITSWVMLASIPQFLGPSNTFKKDIRPKSVTIRIWNWQRNNSSSVFYAISIYFEVSKISPEITISYLL